MLYAKYYILGLEKFNKTFFTYSVLETIFLFAISVIQFYYLRKSLDGSSFISAL